MQIQTDRALVPAGTASTRFLTVKVTAPDDKRRQTDRPAANVALVLDRSGSMSGSKMTNARKAEVKIDTKALTVGCLNDVPCDVDGNTVRIRLGDLVAGPSTVLGAA